MTDYKISMNGSHANGTWEKLIDILVGINSKNKINSIADIACGENPLEFEKLECFDFEKIIRVDGSERTEKNDNILNCNLNYGISCVESDSVDISIAIEIVEHLWNAYTFLEELKRISKVGFIVSKPNTDIKGVASDWYGRQHFFGNKDIKLFDGKPRLEHVNFIPNYELFCIGELLNCTCSLLSSESDGVQFFYFEKKV